MRRNLLHLLHLLNLLHLLHLLTHLRRPLKELLLHLQKMLLPLHLSLYFGLNVRIRLCTAVEILLDARTLNSRVSIQAEVAEVVA